MFKKKDFVILSKISDSIFSSNYLVKTTSFTKNIVFELRAMRKTDIIKYNEYKLVIHEKKIRESIRNAFIVNCIYTFQDYDYLFFVSEMSQGGYFYHYLRSSVYFSRGVVQFYIAEIIIAIQYLHDKKLLNHILTPDNIMLDHRGHIKLRYDFCNASGMDEAGYRKNIEYICIDYIREKKLNKSSDYWCVGIVMYEMLFGVTPFRGASYEETVCNIESKRLKYLRNIDEPAIELLNLFLDKHSFRRIGQCSKEEMLIRNFEFFNGLRWDLLEKKAIDPPLKIKEIIDEDVLGTEMSKKFENYFDRKDNDGYGHMFDGYSEIPIGLLGCCMDIEI